MQHSEAWEVTTSQDQYLNYCLWPYEPVSSVENKFRPVNLLLHSFQVASIDERAFDVVRAIRESIGAFRTVWGVKWIGERIAWEFYFYDYGRRERAVSISRLLAAIKPFIACDVKVDETLAYFMFSIDIDDDLVRGARKLPEVHMYIGNPGSKVSSGVAYAVRPDETVLENFYFFFNAKKHLSDAAAKIGCSAYFDVTKMSPERVLLPELRECQTICVANKARNDTAYFSGVNVDQLLFFLRMLDYPSEIIRFVSDNRDRLDHLLYDVGFDYVGDGDKLTILKSGYYGVF